MTPEFNPNVDTKQKEFDLLPEGDIIFTVDDAKTGMNKSGSRNMYTMRLRPTTLTGNYGNTLCYFPEDTMLHMLLSFCEAAGITQGHVFPPALRASSGLPNSFVDIEPGREQNLLSRNMLNRVVVGVVKHEVGNDGKTRGVININADPPFKPYIVNGVPYQQPALIADLAVPPVQQQPEQATIAPPDDDEDWGDMNENADGTFS